MPAWTKQTRLSITGTAKAALLAIKAHPEFVEGALSLANDYCQQVSTVTEMVSGIVDNVNTDSIISFIDKTLELINDDSTVDGGDDKAEKSTATAVESTSTESTKSTP